MRFTKKRYLAFIMCMFSISLYAPKYVGFTGTQRISLEINTLKRSKFSDIIGNFKPYYQETGKLTSWNGNNYSDASIQEKVDPFGELLKNNMAALVVVKNMTDHSIIIDCDECAYVKGLGDYALPKDEILDIYKPFIKAQKNARNGGIAMTILSSLFGTACLLGTGFGVVYTLTAEPGACVMPIIFGVATAIMVAMGAVGIHEIISAKKTIKLAIEKESKIKSYSYIKSFDNDREPVDHDCGRIRIEPGQTFVDLVFMRRGAKNILNDNSFSLRYQARY